MVFGMFKNITHNFFTKKATRRYPAKDHREDPERYRGEVKLIEENCTFCMTCARKCPTLCIEVERDKGTFRLNPWQCILCGDCVETCNFNALEMINHWKAPDTSQEVIFFQGEPPKKKKAAEG